MAFFQSDGAPLETTLQFHCDCQSELLPICEHFVCPTLAMHGLARFMCQANPPRLLGEKKRLGVTGSLHLVAWLNWQKTVDMQMLSPSELLRMALHRIMDSDRELFGVTVSFRVIERCMENSLGSPRRAR